MGGKTHYLSSSDVGFVSSYLIEEVGRASELLSVINDMSTCRVSSKHLAGHDNFVSTSHQVPRREVQA